jgi:hypothetical protein
MAPAVTTSAEATAAHDSASTVDPTATTGTVSNEVHIRTLQAVGDLDHQHAAPWAKVKCAGAKSGKAACPPIWYPPVYYPPPPPPPPPVTTTEAPEWSHYYKYVKEDWVKAGVGAAVFAGILFLFTTVR